MSRWSIVLGLVWTVLAARIGFGVAHGESLRDDLSLSAFLLFVMTVLVGSRLWDALFRPTTPGGAA